MKIEMLSPQTQVGLRLWAHDVWDDDLLFDDNANTPEFWAWLCYQLCVSQDRPEWFPAGKSATIQYIEGHLLGEAYQLLPRETRLRPQPWMILPRDEEVPQ